MTLDQIFLLLIDKKYLRKRGASVVVSMDAIQVSDFADKDGYVKGKDEQGNPIKAKIGGKSLARRLMEEAEQKKSKKKRKSR